MLARSNNPKDWGVPFGWLELSQQVVPLVVQTLFGERFVAPISNEELRDVAMGRSDGRRRLRSDRDRAWNAAEYLLRRQFSKPGVIPTRRLYKGRDESIPADFWSLKPDTIEGKSDRSLLVFYHDPHGRPDQPMYLVEGPTLKEWLNGPQTWHRWMGRPIQAQSNDLVEGVDELLAINPLAEWIFRHHPHAEWPRNHKKALLETAKRDSMKFKADDFDAAYQRVYQTKVGRHPVTGWPLQPEYQRRLEAA